MIAPLLRIAVILFAATACAAVFLWFRPPTTVEHDHPRNLPWSLPDHRQAQTQLSTDPHGRIVIEIVHLPLPGVSPDMLAWFYRQLPISTVEFEGNIHPLYHIFHPSEHGRIRVLEPASDGTPGIGLNALVEREEWFGPYDSRGSARISRFSSEGMTAVPQFAGIAMGKIVHRFQQREGFSHYTLSATIGSDIPLLGPLVNFYLREKIFTPPMLREWVRHQVEEVGSLSFFLPQLYAQQNPENHFQLN